VRWPEGPRARLFVRLVPLLGAALWPWPGLAHAFTGAFAAACNGVARVDLGWHARVAFEPHYAPDAPWLVLLSITNELSGRSFRIPVDTRTVAYLRFAVFFALALASSILRTRRGVRAAAAGVAVLAAITAVTIELGVLQVFGMLGVLRLGVLAQSVLSVGILTLVSYPSMAFAVPGLVWVLTMRLAAPAPDDA